MDSNSVYSEAVLKGMTAYFNVTHMNCPECEKWLCEALRSLKGVLLVDVFIEKGILIATYDPTAANIEKLLEVISQTGQHVYRYYHAELIGHLPTTEALRSSTL